MFSTSIWALDLLNYFHSRPRVWLTFLDKQRLSGFKASHHIGYEASPDMSLRCHYPLYLYISAYLVCWLILLSLIERTSVPLPSEPANLNRTAKYDLSRIFLMEKKNVSESVLRDPWLSARSLSLRINRFRPWIFPSALRSSI